MTDDQGIEALEQALRECAEAALDRIETLEELLVECTEVLIARGGHGELVARIRHLLDEDLRPASGGETHYEVSLSYSTRPRRRARSSDGALTSAWRGKGKALGSSGAA